MNELLSKINDIGMELTRLYDEIGEMEEERRFIYRNYEFSYKKNRETYERYWNLDKAIDRKKELVEYLKHKRELLRCSYRRSRVGYEYYNPLSETDIRDIIHADGSIIGFKL